ncbi:MAG: hypothetical protein HY815_03055 [Candidatus Riflebacteria bacterium]|nr:hypothetical protein [Candidatus Riflebacteria bacterium]
MSFTPASRPVESFPSTPTLTVSGGVRTTGNMPTHTTAGGQEYLASSTFVDRSAICTSPRTLRSATIRELFTNVNCLKTNRLA